MPPTAQHSQICVVQFSYVLWFECTARPDGTVLIQVTFNLFLTTKSSNFVGSVLEFYHSNIFNRRRPLLAGTA